MLGSKTAPDNGDRRRLLAHALKGMGASLSLALLPGNELRAAPRLARDPFTLGVASGDPTPDGIVLWTRLLPQPAEPESLGNAPLPVRWRVATHPSMARVVATGTAIAWPLLAHSVHVELRGLRPGRDYWYQFSHGSEESPIGHFRTAPARDELPSKLRFAVASCQDWRGGYYHAYRDMLERDLDLVLHLGDYIYEKKIVYANREGATLPAGWEAKAVDLETYRRRHAFYKLDPDLQAAHAAFPFAAIWDDHEVANDYAGLAGVRDARRTQAYQAWYEHMPVRLRTTDWPLANLRIYRHLEFGRLASINLLDARQYRSALPCTQEASRRCAAASAPEVTMLGAAQERWLSARLRDRGARWNLIAQQVMMAQFEQGNVERGWFRNDTWDGYPVARRRLLDEVVDSGAKNPVVLTGDWHSAFVNDLKLDFDHARAPAIAPEFVTPSISSGGDAAPSAQRWAPTLPYNPHVRYYDGDRRGYFLATLKADQLRMDLRLMTSVERKSGRGYAARSWVVQDGVPFATPA